MWPLKNAWGNPRSEMCESDPPFFESIGVKKCPPSPLNQAATEEVFEKMYPGKNNCLYCISRPRVVAQPNRGESSACLTICSWLLPAHEQIERQAEDGDPNEP